MVKNRKHFTDETPEKPAQNVAGQKPEKLTPQQILGLIAEVTTDTPMQRFKKVILQGQLARLNKAKKKFEEDHEFLGMIPTGSYKVQGGMATALSVPHYRFVGWNRGKKYTGEKLRELRQQRAAA